ncbi:KAP NTPase P-loop domain-containing protein [Treponema primitia]|uniref:KAP NTPase P-loop domain-containing protein n=1 Tax=Treponema primitia TaxID=88058 RepID=UPI000255512D|nr:KAP NTPase P-loop domain-containing protein [Treponema primitia]
MFTKNAILTYINKERTDYAILLTGEWGSGKTYFINNILIPELKATDKIVLYESMNGIDTTENLIIKLIDKYLLFGKTENIASKGIKKILQFGKSTEVFDIDKYIKTINQFQYQFKLNRINSESFNNTIIFMDDLERLSKHVNIQDLFGMLYNIFIAKGARVIFITNEAKIRIKQYRKIKEKYIRYAYVFEADLREQFAGCLKSINIENDHYEKFIESKYDLIADALRQADHVNLRTFLFFCDIFEVIYNEIAEIKHHNEIIDGLFCTALLLSIEYKRGMEREIKKYLKDYRDIKILNSLEKNSYLLDFSTRYGLSPLEKYFFYDDGLADYIISGVFNAVNIQLILRNHFGFNAQAAANDNYIAIEFVKNYKAMEEDELDKNIDVLLNYCRDGSYPSYFYFDIYRILSTLYNGRYYTKKSLSEMESVLRIGFNIALDKEGANMNAAMDVIIPDTYPRPQRKENMTLIEELEYKVREKGFVQSFTRSQAGFAELFEAANEKEDRRFIQLYLKCNRQKLFEGIVKTGNLDRFGALNNGGIWWFEKIFDEMSGISNTKEAYQNQISYLQQIQTYLQNLCNSTPEGLHKRRLDDLLVSLDKVIAKF